MRAIKPWLKFGVALTALFSGFVGFTIYRGSAACFPVTSSGCGSWSLFDVFHATLMLFTLNSQMEATGEISPFLQFARIAAPAVAFYTVLEGFFSISRPTWLRVMLFVRTRKGKHVVICGNGRLASVLALGHRREGDEVIVLAPGLQNRLKTDEEAQGAIMVPDDPKDPEALRRTKPWKAKRIYAVMESDSDNLEILRRLQEVEKEERDIEEDAPPDLDHVRVHQQDAASTRALVQDPEFQSKIFDLSHSAAHTLLIEHPPFVIACHGTLVANDIVIGGTSPLAKELVVALAETWRTGHPILERPNEAGQSLRIRLFGRGVVAMCQELQAWHPELSSVWALEAEELKENDPRPLQSDFLQPEKECQTIYLCYDDAGESRNIAAKLLKHSGNKNRDIVIASEGESLLESDLLTREGVVSLSRIWSFGLISEETSPALLIGGAHRYLSEYVDSYYRNKSPVAPSKEEKASSLRMAMLIPALLASEGWRIVRQRPSEGVQPPNDFNAKIDRLASREHYAWICDALVHGQRYGLDKKRSGEEMGNPNLVLWPDPKKRTNESHEERQVCLVEERQEWMAEEWEPYMRELFRSEVLDRWQIHHAKEERHLDEKGVERNRRLFELMFDKAGEEQSDHVGWLRRFGLAVVSDNRFCASDTMERQ